MDKKRVDMMADMLVESTVGYLAVLMAAKMV